MNLGLFFKFLAIGSTAAASLISADSLLSRGSALYYQGELKKSFESYEHAARLSSTTAEAWLNGAVVLEEMGRPREAIHWYERAASISPDENVLNALAWARFRAGEFKKARIGFEQILQRRPDHVYALLGLARLELAESHPSEALNYLDKAAPSAPLLNLIPYYRGQAHEALHQPAQELEAYRRAVVADSYFLEGREALGRAQLRGKNFNEAWKHFSKIMDVEPRLKRLQNLIQKVRPLLTKKISDIRPSLQNPAQPYLVESNDQGGTPLLRVGIGTNSMGKPMPRPLVSFDVNGPFSIVDPKSGKRWVQGKGGQTWIARLKRVKKKLYIEVADSSGKVRLLRGEPLIIRPESRTKGFIVLDNMVYAQGSNWTGIADKTVRGDLEISIYPSKRSLKLVNILDLENYTHGVVAAEMPVASPLEALKSQAVVARSHAYFIKTVTRRHRREGYDLCDEQHCQVYSGVRAESSRSRAVVEATSGRIVTYNGKVAHVIYSSNCGGHTQSGRDLTGWGNVPYWIGVRDWQTPQSQRSPWHLRQSLYGAPPSYCQPSTYVHPSHYRWTRVISFKDLEEKINRKFKIGKLLQLRPGRRADSGNINTLVIQGSARQVKVTSEMSIRGLLGLGSLRSTLFIFDPEYGPDLKPVNLVFHGAGWGHGVGLCQSGAMGRADAGQSYEEIIKAYFQGTALGQLKY